MERKKTNRHSRFGIRARVGLLIVAIGFSISIISFSLAVYLHIAIAMENVIEIDLYSGSAIIKRLDRALVEELITEGRKIYDSIPEEVRKDRLSEEYLSYFKSISTGKYRALRAALDEWADIEDVKSLDIRITDSENLRWVYLMNTGEKKSGEYAPGYWETGDEAVRAFRDSTAEEEAEMEKYFAPVQMLLSLRDVKISDMDRFCTVTDICDENGEVIALLGVGEVLEDYRDELHAFSALNLMALVFFLIVILVLSNLIFNNWLVRPLTELAHAAQDYVAAREKGHNGHYFEQVTINSRDEMQLLKDSMVDMEEDLTRYLQDIEHMTAEKERASVEMELSARIQLSLLPQRLENYNGPKSFDIHALIDPAKDVGGDFYDYYVIDEDHIAIAVADVSDKGVPAALFMIVTKTLLQTAGMTYSSPAEIVENVNRKLCEQNPEMMFVTIFFGIYTVSERKLCFVNAGHEELVLYRKEEGKFSMETGEHDLVVAVVPEAVFTEHTLTFAPGDRLFMYTDGVPEANNEKGEMLGDERMLAALNEQKELSGDAFLSGMRERVAQFAGEAPQFDDVTMLLLEVL